MEKSFDEFVAEQNALAAKEAEDRGMQKGMKKGIQKGKEEGRQEGRQEAMDDFDAGINDAASLMRTWPVSEAEINTVLNLLRQTRSHAQVVT